MRGGVRVRVRVCVSKDELQGQQLRMIARPSVTCYAAFTIRMLARSDPVGEVFTLNAVWAAKNRSLRLLTRHQFLYGPRRMVRPHTHTRTHAHTHTRTHAHTHTRTHAHTHTIN